MKRLIILIILLCFLPLTTMAKGKKVASQVPKFLDQSDQMGTLGGKKGSWGDVNNDGYPDCIAGGHLWINQKGRKFLKKTREFGLGKRVRDAIWADFNNDGFQDLYVYRGPGRLYLNRKGKGFVKVAMVKNPHRKGEAAAAGDFNGDGFLDIYLANYEDWKGNTHPYPDVLFLNRGKMGKWKGVEKVEFEIAWQATGDGILAGRGAGTCDFDRDGRLEVYVSNYRLGPNQLWKWNKEGKAVDLAPGFKVAGKGGNLKVGYGGGRVIEGAFGHTIGSDWADFNNDGYFDLLVGNFSHSPKYQDRMMILKNLGPEKKYCFRDLSQRAKIPWQESYATVSCGDFDNDGRPDFYVTTVYKGDTSRLFRNLGGFRFRDVTKRTKAFSKLTYQAAWADVDQDGDLDLMTGGKVLINEGNDHQWLQIDLVGSHCNRDGIGAQVKVLAGQREIFLQKTAGTGSGNQNSPYLHTGLGGHKGEVEIEVRWLCGKVSKMKAMANQRIRIKE